MEVLQTLKRLLENCGDHDFVLDSILELDVHDVFERAGIEQRHDQPQIVEIDERNEVIDDVWVFATRHYVNLVPDVVHVLVLEKFHVYDFDCAHLLVVRRLGVDAFGFPDKAEGALTDGSDELIAA